MKISRFVFSWMMLAGAASATTATNTIGSVADTFAYQFDPAGNYGTNTTVVLKDYAQSGGRKTWLKFNISSLDTALSSALEFTTTIHAYSPGDTIGVYGLKSSLPASWDAWDESTLNWYNAPANDTGGNGFNVNSVYLGEIIGVAGAGNANVFSNAALTAFLNSDASGNNDGLVTIMLNVTMAANGGGEFASRENATYAPPTLRIVGGFNSGWSVDTNNPVSPLEFTAPDGTTVDVLNNVGPIFAGGIGPDTYTTTLLGVTNVNGYAVFNCRADYVPTSLSSLYSLKFKIDGNSAEMLVAGESNIVERFECGNIVGTSDSFKQFYVGQRYTELFSGNGKLPPILYWPREDLYFHGFWDRDYTHAYGWAHRKDPKSEGNFLLQNPPMACDAKYSNLSDGTTVPALQERFVFRYSTNMWDAYTPLTNQPSAFRDELAGMVMFDQWGGSGFKYGKFCLEWLRKACAGKLDFFTITHNWDTFGLDAAGPDYYRSADYNYPNVEFGTKQELLDYIATGNQFGRMALHCNYMYLADGSYSLSEGLIKRAKNASGVEQWYADMSTIMPLVQRQEEDIRRDLAPEALFFDQTASGTVINYDATTSQAGTLSGARAFMKQVCEFSKNEHHAPLASESLVEEYLLGQYVDTGDFGIKDGYTRYDFTPEYKLRRLHRLSAFHSMGLGYRFFDNGNIENGIDIYFNDDVKMDSYRACELLYGNGGYLYSLARNTNPLRKVTALTEMFTVGICQKYYLLKTVDYVKYGKAGVWKTFDQIVEDASTTTLADLQSWYRQFHIRYTNGCHIWVNRDVSNLVVTLPDTSTVTLPENGWAVYTEDGNVVAYTALSGSDRVDFCEDCNRQIKYVNPRTAASYAGVAKPTVWIDGTIHLMLDDPADTLLHEYRASTKLVPGCHKGEVISYIDTGLSSLAGLDVSGISDTILHVISNGDQVDRFLVRTAFDTRNAQSAAYDSHMLMLSDTNVFTMNGLAVIPQISSSYAKEYIAIRGNQRKYRSIMGHPDDPGSMVWTQYGNTSLYSSGDITPADRSLRELDNPNASIWTVYLYAIYKYPVLFPGGGSYTDAISIGKRSSAISVGIDNDLWVLCDDGEVLNILTADGSITDRFYLDGSIASPKGMAYDRGRLWISDSSNGRIYQVATSEAGYEAWTTAYAMTGTLASATNDYDGDGWNNLLEYGLGGDPTNPTVVGTSPLGGILAANGTNWLEYIHLVRTNANNGLTYTIEQTADLVNQPWSNSLDAVVAGIGSAPDINFQTVTNRVPTDGKTNEFLRLSIEK